MALERKKTLNVFKDAEAAWGSYDDFPVGACGTDPMPHLSRNRCPQPFYLVSAADQVLIQMSGDGEILFAEHEPASMPLVPGDTVYIPAGVPSRLVPRGENVQLRLKAEPPATEAVAWYCARCRALVHAVELAAGIAQEGYASAVRAFNDDNRLRTCASCSEVHARVELGDIAWERVAAALRTEEP